MDNEWIKALGIDYGTVRIGLATSDDIGLLAHPFRTISGKTEDNPIEVLAGIIAEREIKDVVFGMPYHTDGSESRVSKEVVKFWAKLEAYISDETIKFHEIDELRTSKTAREKLDQAGKRQKDVKAILDQAAAVEILQDWLNRRADLSANFDLYPELD